MPPTAVQILHRGSALPPMSARSVRQLDSEAWLRLLPNSSGVAQLGRPRDRSLHGGALRSLIRALQPVHPPTPNHHAGSRGRTPAHAALLVVSAEAHTIEGLLGAGHTSQPGNSHTSQPDVGRTSRLSAALVEHTPWRILIDLDAPAPAALLDRLRAGLGTHGYACVRALRHVNAPCWPPRAVASNPASSSSSSTRRFSFNSTRLNSTHQAQPGRRHGRSLPRWLISNPRSG